ncbi:transcription factor RAX1-like [Pyrus ussuriensis x Pyrus communis]|uniref:Transcription factor RAX1-like n=1 Tax=Pyrus ussuriensis x Pyrus communis TaxID=2448454 RepID=A0A5N5FFF5_9ROSA|nr:transcription factor RAX1-like [Pyrus ussuriensis x Pyrus communis]
MRKGFYFLCQSLQEFSTLLIFLHFVGLRGCRKRPDIKHGSFTKEEDRIICSLYNQIGSRQDSATFKGKGYVQTKKKKGK